MSGEIIMNDNGHVELGDIAPPPEMNIARLFPPGISEETIKQAGMTAAMLDPELRGNMNPAQITAALPQDANKNDIANLMNIMAPGKADALLASYAGSAQGESEGVSVSTQGAEGMPPEQDKDFVPLPQAVKEGTDILDEAKKVADQANEDAKEGKYNPGAMSKVMEKFQGWASGSAVKYTSMGIIIAIFAFYILLIQSFRMAGGRGAGGGGGR